MDRISHFLGKSAASRFGFSDKDVIRLLDSTVLKYRKHPKALKGATVPTNLMNLMSNAVTRPKNIYLDTSMKGKGALIFVGTVSKNRKKLIKAVIHTNYKHKGRRVHIAKSFGIVDKNDLNGKQYIKIK